MKPKKITLFLLVVCIILSVVGCSDGANSKTPEPVFFDECDILIKPDSVIKSIKTSSNSKLSSNGIVTKIEYRFNGDETSYSDYINYLNENGLTLQSISDAENSVIADGMKMASIKKDGNSIIINIVPEDFRVVTVTKEMTTGTSDALEFAEFSFNKIEVTKEVYPEDASGVYLYYPEKEGHTFVTLRGSVKNLAAENLDSKYINAELTINNKYKYSGEVIFGANPAALTDYAITPFEESPLCFIFTVPSDAVSVMTSGLITIQFNENFARGGDEYQYTYNFVVPC